MKHTACVQMDPSADTSPYSPSDKTHPAQNYQGLIDTLANKVEATVIGIRHDLHKNSE